MSSTLERGLSPTRVALANGGVVLVQENRGIPVVAVNLTFDAGSVCDPDGLPGVAYLTAKTIDRGTRARPAGAIADLLDDRGVSLRAAVTRHTFTLSCVCLADDFTNIFELIAEIARSATLSADQLEKRRIKAISSVRQDQDNTASRASAAMHRYLYGAGHPYGRPRKGTVQSLERIGRDHLLNFRSSHLLPGALRLAVVGDIDPGLVIDGADRLLGDWFGPPPPLHVIAPPPRPSRSVAVVPLPGKAQTDIAYGFSTVSRLDPGFYGYLVMNTVLGQFGLGGRLADNIRERQGMAYYAYSTLDPMLADSPLVIRVGVDPDNLIRALAAIDYEVGELAASGPTASEFDDAIESLVGGVPRTLETNESIAEFLQSAEQFGLGTDYDRQLPQLLRGVTRDDVVDAAREVLEPTRAAIAVAGPHDPDDPALAAPPPSRRGQALS